MKLCKLIPISLAAFLLLTGCGSGKSNIEDYLKEENAIMGRMMEEMDSARNTGSAELDFLHGMIPHHQSAVEMSKSYLEYAGNGENNEEMSKRVRERRQEPPSGDENCRTTVKQVFCFHGTIPVHV
jgi:protease II